MKRKIFIIEDNSEIVELLKIFLGQEGFEVSSASSAEEALEKFSQISPDLMILDINLPGMSGFDFIPLIRKKTEVPILCLTARTSDIDVVTGLSNGADDYLPKPFSSAVLVAHVRALLRRSDASLSQGEALKSYKFGDFEFFPSTFTLLKNKNHLPLSMNEYRLLDFLIKNAGTPFEPEKIYKEVWKNEYGDTTSVAVYIQRLRRKLENDPKNPKFILTQAGYGYSFNKEELL